MKTWQLDIKVRIMSPNNIYDILRQRRRVYKGITTDIRSGKITVKIIMGLKLTLWIIAIFGSYLISPLWFIGMVIKC